MSTSKEDIQEHKLEDDLVALLTFKEFNKSSVKTKEYTVREMFTRQLVQLVGMSAAKAMAITEKYPTPQLLKREYDKLDKKAGENLLAKITYGTMNRMIGAVASKTIYQLYTWDTLL